MVSFMKYFKFLWLIWTPVMASVYPPSPEQLRPFIEGKSTQRAPSSSSSIELAISYHKASKESPSKNSCKSFKGFYENKELIFHSFLPIKIVEACDFSRKSLQNFYRDHENEVPSWALSQFLTRILEKAEKLNINELQAVLHYRLSFFGSIKKYKEEHLLKAKRLNKSRDLRSKINNRLDLIAPRLKRKVSPKDYYSVAKNFEEKRNFKRARTYYRKIINGSSFSLKQKYRAWTRIAMTYKKERKGEDYVRSLKVLGNFLKKRLDNSKETLRLYEENQIALARGIWTLHQRDEARKVLQEVITYKGISPESMAVIYWLKGSMEMEAKNNKGAIPYFEKAAEFDHKNEDLNESIIWALSWNLYQDKKFRKAAKYLDRGAKKIEDVHTQRKLRFWQAKALQKDKRYLQASRILHVISKEAPFSYYGIMAAKELSLPYSPIEPPKQDFKVDEIPLFSWLYVLGEKDFAKNYLLYHVTKEKKVKDISPYLKYFAQVEAYSEGIMAFYRIHPEKREEFMEQELDLLYPSPYRTLVTKVSERHGLSPAIIYSITRQESAFNPFARSWADAFGLMQLTPETARVLTSTNKLKLPYELFKPEVNINLGTKLFKRLKSKFNNNYILAIASYNASQRVVKRWYKERYVDDPLEFIEKIPYKETRNYVKLVLRNFIIYKRVLSKDKFYFPEEIISNEQS